MICQFLLNIGHCERIGELPSSRNTAVIIQKDGGKILPFDLDAGSGCGVVIRSKMDEKFVDSGLIVNRACVISPVM